MLFFDSVLSLGLLLPEAAGAGAIGHSCRVHLNRPAIEIIEARHCQIVSVATSSRRSGFLAKPLRVHLPTAV